MRLKKVAAVFLAAAVSLSAFSNAVVPKADASKSIEDLRKELAENTKKKQEAIKEKVSKQTELNSAVDKKNDLDIQIAALEADIDDIDDVVRDKQAEIDEKNKQIKELDSQIDKNKDLLKERMKVMYENGNVTYLEMIFEAKGLSDLFTRIAVIRDIVSHDRELIQSYVDAKETIEDAKATVEKEKAEQDEAKAMLVDKKADIEKKSAERDKIIQTLKSQIDELEKFEAESEKYEKQAKEELQRALAEQEAKKKSSSSAPAKVGNGDFCWPSATSTRVTSKYGYRIHPISNVEKFHSGIDIAAEQGTNVLAAQDGTVVTAGWNNGYGYYITINHGGGVVTLYGHNSKLLVSAGDEVKKGQVIAKVGSTGISTGPHIHFEVIVNGSTQDPEKYF
ncbi:MAG: peptidoglycan DD-metalloendopeptidase family protein [Clostridia bacterium]|nr:peptidoglycan DD-metalloendopeptidase family protein [Clostridia bacterium]